MYFGLQWNWQKCREAHVPRDIPCIAREEINVALPENPNEWDFMQLYLTDEITSLVVTETNRYADHYIYENDDTLK